MINLRRYATPGEPRDYGMFCLVVGNRCWVSERPGRGRPADAIAADSCLDTGPIDSPLSGDLRATWGRFGGVEGEHPFGGFWPT
jgi:hypothetical protein